MIIESILLMSMLCSNSGNKEKIVEEKTVEIKQEKIKEKTIYEKMGIPKSVFLNILQDAKEIHPDDYYMQNFRIKYQCEEYLENQQLRRGMQ
jgi:hypothetical protein